jgi:hypothetical protein
MTTLNVFITQCSAMKKEIGLPVETGVDEVNESNSTNQNVTNLFKKTNELKINATK